MGYCGAARLIIPAKELLHRGPGYQYPFAWLALDANDHYGWTCAKTDRFAPADRAVICMCGPVAPARYLSGRRRPPVRWRYRPALVARRI
jgi:hypothetical protein